MPAAWSHWQRYGKSEEQRNAKEVVTHRFPTRRRFCRVLVAAAAGSRLVSGQATSPAGTISVQGRQATFSVDYPRPLESVAYTFIQQYGWRITFEEAPLVHSGDIVDVTRDFSAGIRVFDPRGGRLEFSYDLAPGEKPPADPEPVLRSAIRSYHQAGFPGRYDLIATENYLHLVPVARTAEGGFLEQIRSPLDALVTVEGGGRPPEPVLREVTRAAEAVSGSRMQIGRTPFSAGIQPRIERRFENTEARAVLRALIRATGKSRIWYLLYHIRSKRYFLSVV